MTRPRRLLTVGHSYTVGLNRRLADEMARQGAGRWEVTAVAPAFVHGDLRPIRLEPISGETCQLVPVTAYCSRRPHIMFYGRALRSLLRERWDMIHCWEEPFILAGGQVSHWARGQRLVYYTFQNIAKRYPPPFSWIERDAMSRASGWIAAGHTVLTAIGDQRGYADKPHRMITLGVDTAIFRPDLDSGMDVRQALGWSDPGPPVVGYLGRFVLEKGLRRLIAALDGMPSPWRALFVGGGPLEGELRSWAARLSGDRVRVVTGVPHEAVPRYLNAMDVLAAPSQTTPRWKEQLGRMLIEGMACGVPVVGSESGEIPFVIGDGGLVLPEADQGSWALGLCDLLENPSRRKEMSEAGRMRVQTEFAWPVIAQRHLEFFDRVIHTTR
ncbi:MAG: glycosyltransferase family 4 protein [Planctomycetes bacterium]|nr:glycosyltransferase family 4 protein [Planctomycetota bacterium]